jgi:hypothetical protein
VTLNYVTLTLDLYDGQGNPVTTGTALFIPNTQLTDAGVELVPQAPIPAVFRSPNGLPQVKLLGTDNSGPLPAGWAWTVTFTGVPGNPASFSFFLPFASGASQFLSAQAPVSTAPPVIAYLPMPTGTPSSGQVPGWTGPGAGQAVWTTVPVNPMTTSGDTVYGGTAGAFTRLAGDTSNTRKFLREQASGGVAQPPAWDTIQAADVPTLNQNTSGTAAGLSATLGIGSGGTGQTTQQAAIDALTGSQSSGKVLRSDGVHATLAAIQAADVPTLNQNTTGTASNITGRLDQVPAPAAAVSLNSQKITSLANGSGAQDAAAFGQLPVLTAADTSAVVAGTATAPTVRTATIDVIATQHPAAADWSNNSHKITSLTNGSGAQDAAAFGQIPVVEGTLSNIKPVAAAAALGASAKWASSDHVHAWGQTAPARFSPGNPTGTTSTTQVMMGLACAFTPTGSGLVLVTFCATVKTTVAQVPVTIGGRFGTSTAPTNGAALTGTRIGPAADPAISGSGAGSSTTFAITDVLTLTPATAYWFDLAVATGNVSDTASASAVSLTLVELP